MSIYINVYFIILLLLFKVKNFLIYNIYAVYLAIYYVFFTFYLKKIRYKVE